ncbi:hypothetical protein PSM_A0008 [Pseudoalteromonas sp. SM9913]|nr:hypothetical protein PSM_A0008 [Pseudoalteromonas sp. SM9913]
MRFNGSFMVNPLLTNINKTLKSQHNAGFLNSYWLLFL